MVYSTYLSLGIEISSIARRVLYNICISSAGEIALTFPQIICGSSDLCRVLGGPETHNNAVCWFVCFLGLALNSTTTATRIDTASGIWKWWGPKGFGFNPFASRNCTFHWFELLLYKMGWCLYTQSYIESVGTQIELGRVRNPLTLMDFDWAGYDGAECCHNIIFRGICILYGQKGEYII